MEHYFTGKPSSESNRNSFKVNILDKLYVFYADSGVFSKSKLDFGTRLLIETAGKFQGKVLDIGCGYGPIGIVMASNGATVTMADINERALELAKTNSVVNNVYTAVINSDMYSNVEDKYDYIITNPPIRIGKEKLLEFLKGAKDHLVRNGELWFVIRKKQGAESVMETLRDTYEVKMVAKRKGFCIIKAKNVDLEVLE